MRRRDREDHELGRAAQELGVCRRYQRLRQVDARQAALIPMRSVDLVGHVRPVRDEDDGLALRDDGGERRAPRPGADDRYGRRGSAHRERRGLGADRRVGLDGTDLGFRRLGSLTEARSLKTRRTGVPWNPNVSRRRFSR